ncbi:MAG: hypothetical protein LBU14_00125 [Candidatus Peribacteria bacterium]|nr:hypothetical protein [Candidatus Peribacteria bacterium]
MILFSSCSTQEEFIETNQNLISCKINMSQCTSTIDANLQTFAEKTLNQTLNELKSKNVTN